METLFDQLVFSARTDVSHRRRDKGIKHYKHDYIFRYAFNRPGSKKLNKKCMFSVGYCQMATYFNRS